MKKVVVIVAVFALLLLTIGSAVLALRDSLDGDDGGRRAPRSAQTPVPPEATVPPAPELERFYAQGIDWAPCERNDAHDCARIEAPVDYAEPEGETFELNLLRVPARGGEPIGSLVVNPGGPGAPGTSYAALGGYAFRQPLLERYDIVGFDPRGTGDSSPVDCLSDEELDTYIAMDPVPDDMGEEEWVADMAEAFGAGCVENTGEIIGHVTTIEAARDMDVLRATLGETELDYLGASYGTKLGATYAELFPDKVGRFVLDGAVDVSIDSRTLSLEQAAGFETALRAYIQSCLDVTDDCFLGDSVEEGLERISELMEEIDDEPLPTEGDRSLRAGNAFYGLVAPLYNEDSWFMLSKALQGAFTGDGTGLLTLSDMYASRRGGRFVDNSMEAIYAINCLDDPSAVEPEDVPEQYADFEEAAPTFGRIFAWSLVGCSGIQVESSEEPLDIRAEGAAPILVLGTTRDPATPMKWAEALADQLESGVLVRRDGDGHTAYNTGNECIDEVVEDYLLEGAVPEDPTSC